MKKIFALIPVLFFAFIAKSQSYTVPRGLPYQDTRYVEYKAPQGFVLFDSLIMFKNIADTNMKPLNPALAYISNFAGDSTFWVWDMVRWKKLNSGTGGGGGGDNANVGVGYRWLKPATQEIKTAFAGFGIGLDSTSNTNGITITADTSKLSTRYTIDSLALIMDTIGWQRTLITNPNLWQDNFSHDHMTTFTWDSLKQMKIHVTDWVNITGDQVSGRESLLKMYVNDNPYSVQGFGNSTIYDQYYTPVYYGYSSAYPGIRYTSALSFRALIPASKDYYRSDTLLGLFNFSAARTDNATDPNAGTFTSITTAPLWFVGNNGVPYHRILASGQHTFDQYGSGTFTGTLSKLAGFTSAGEVIEVNPSSLSYVSSVATNDATGIHGGTITSTGTLYIDTFHITTREWLYKAIDSLAIASSPTWQQTLSSGSTLTQDNTIAAGNHNFTWNNLNGYTLNLNGQYLLSTATTYTLNGLDSGYILATNAIQAKAASARYLAGTTAQWGYASSTSVTNGFHATSSGVFEDGMTTNSETNFMTLNSSTGLIGYRTSIPTSVISGGAALTKTDDANVTLTLGGSPTTALLAATSLTLGWTGQLAVTRGGTGQSSYTDGQLLIGNSSGNTLTKATLTAGSNITITNGNGSITIAATAGGINALAAIGSSPNANGATISGNTLNLEPASISFGGVLSAPSVAQTYSGTKTHTQGNADAYTFNGTWTPTGASQEHILIIPSINMRTTAGDSAFAVNIHPFIDGNSSGSGKVPYALKIDPIYTNTSQLGITGAIIARGNIDPLINNNGGLGRNGLAWSALWATTTQTGTINFSTLGTSSTLAFTNNQGTSATMYPHGHFVLGEGNNGTTDDSSQLHVKGDVETNGIYAPQLQSLTISSVAPQGVTGATTYTYVVVAWCFNGTYVVSSAVSTTTGNATLSGSNFNRITWNQVVGAYRYYVYRTVGGSAQGIIKVWGIARTTYDDINGAAGDGSTPPASGINNTGSIKFDGSLIQSATITAAGTTGARTINKGAGCVNFAAAATSLVVTDNFVTTTSLVNAWVQTHDATLFSCQTVPASGSFTIYGNAAATAETKVCFEVINTY